ncbi:CRAL-TRIO domain-containing protein [Cyathus striatus]|nr:CRAL-TRIO domain-containing protein [Cyathus striatus]
MYDELYNHFTKDDYALPEVEKGGLMEVEKFFLTRECLLRFLRATKWKVTQAIRRLENTLKWRREFGIYDKVSTEHVEPEAVTGKEVLFGYDMGGRPALYLVPSRQNTDTQQRQIEYAFWMLERAIDLMEPGVENIALLINFAERSKSPSMGTALKVLEILQEHYPERLGKALMINTPFVVNVFFKLITPFIDPVTREKMKFNPQAVQDGMFDKSRLMKQWWEGDCDFEYVHEKYWPSLVKICEGRHTRWFECWRALGGKVGIKEWDYKQVDGVERAMDVKVVKSVEADKEDVATQEGRSESANEMLSEGTFMAI